MSCGQKNQNNQKGGVHLTERTCSPYNPIIKQMVDDCLGLPIYPVTSVDAVIDEEGNTLRRLLDELLDKVKSGQSDVNIEITKIRNLLEQLEERVVDKEAFDALKKLVYAISSVSNISRSLTDLEENIYERDSEDIQTPTPYIVSYIKNLKESFEDFVSFVCEVLSFNGDVSYSDVETEDGKIKIINEIIKLQRVIGGDQDESLISQIESLREMQGYLKNLIVAIANFDTSKDIGQFSEQFGLTSSDERTHLIEIIYQIASLIEQIGGTSGGDSIIERLNTLEEKAKTHASLDGDVLKNAPNNDESQRKKYEVLSRTQYPPTSVYFATTEKGGIQTGYLNYLGFLKCVNVPEGMLDVCPIGHTDNTKGYPLYQRVETSGNYTYEPIKRNGVQLRAGEGVFSPDDYLTVIKLIVQDKKPAQSYSGNPITDALGNEILNEDLYIEYAEGQYSRLGNVNVINTGTGTEDQVDITDANIIINHLLSDPPTDHVDIQGSSQTLTAPPTSPIKPTPTDLAKAWIVFEKGKDSVLYPCIDGKLYVDLYTNNVYRFKQEGTSGEMVKVNDIRFVEGNGISIDTEEVTRTSPSNDQEVVEAYTKVTIEAQPINFTGAGTVTITDDTEDNSRNVTIKGQPINFIQDGSVNIVESINNAGRNVTISYPTIVKDSPDHAKPGEYYINKQTRNIYAKPSAVDVETATDPYTIEDVTASVDKLLTLNASSPSSQQQIKRDVDEVLLNRCNIYVNEQLDEILRLRKLIKALVTQEEQDPGVTIYYQTTINGENTVLEEQVVGPKELVAEIAKYDTNGDGVFNITDITGLIDKLLENNENSTKVVINENKDVGASLYLKNANGSTQITISDAANKAKYFGKIFKVDYGNDISKDTYSYDEYYFASNGAFRSVIPQYALSISPGTANNQLNVQLQADGIVLSSQTINFDYDTRPVTNTEQQNLAAPLFLGDLVDTPSGTYPTYLEQGNGLSDRFNPINISSPQGSFNLENFLEDYQLFMDETANSTQNVSPIAVISHEARKEFIDVLNETSYVNRMNLIETYKVAKYFKCLDKSNEEVKHILQVTSFSVIDPTQALTEENIKTDTEVEIVDSTPIEENVNYYIENYGLTLRFVYENNVLIPIVVSLEQRKAPASRVTDSVDETIADIRPNEFLEIPEISSTDLYFDVTNVVNTFGHELLRICGTFVGVQDLNIHFITGTNHSISVPQSSSMTVNETNHSILTPENLPPIVDGTQYTYEIFNNTFRYWESSSR